MLPITPAQHAMPLFLYSFITHLLLYFFMLSCLSSPYVNIVCALYQRKSQRNQVCLIGFSSLISVSKWFKNIFFITNTNSKLNSSNITYTFVRRGQEIILIIVVTCRMEELTTSCIEKKKAFLCCSSQVFFKKYFSYFIVEEKK
jgi:hypothetical protein